MPAPIALFVYNRPWHTQQTIEALKQNHLAGQSDLIIFSDGPKSEKGVEKVTQVREFIRSITGFRTVEIHESTVNKGLAGSVISGVTKVLERYESIIVLEDDMITSPYFLSYMNQGLQMYADQNEVISIHGYMYPVNEKLPEFFFIKGAECWGWATWRRGWEIFEPNAWKLLSNILFRNKSREFDFDNGYPYTRMLLSQCLGRVDSWAIRWYASAFLAEKLTLYPGKSLLENIGFDNSGTHTKSSDNNLFKAAASADPVVVNRIETKENKEVRNALSLYFKKNRVSIFKKLFA
jgi:hypothetical protein